MEVYRCINKELSINNQKLKNVIQKYKIEVAHLNRLLLEQRQEFNRLKASIARSVEENYMEMMALICQDKTSKIEKQSRVDIASHRRSCNIVKETDAIHKSRSPRAGSSSCATHRNGSNITALRDINENINSNKYVAESPRSSSKKTPSIPKIVIESVESSDTCNQGQLDRDEDLETSNNHAEEINSSEHSGLEQTPEPNSRLRTINEERNSVSIVSNETLSDATINSLLNAPCSTPDNRKKRSDDTILKQKKVRVLVKKMNVDNQNCTHACNSLTSNLSVESNSISIEACHSETQYSKLGTTSKNNTNSSGNESVIGISKTQSKPKRKSSKDIHDKENTDVDDEFTITDDESNVGRRRLRNKQICLREPSLRRKLRNTTNLKL